MKLLKPILISILLAKSTLDVSAANGLATGKITYFSQWSSGLIIQIDGDNNLNPAGCSRPGFYAINLDKDPSSANTSDSVISANDNYKFMKAILLTAKLNSERVQLTIFGSGCMSDRPRIISVRVL